MSAPAGERAPRPAPDAAGRALTLFGDAGERGRTELADRVVEKIASTAAGEVSHTVDLAPTLAQRLPGRHAAPARVDATISGRLVQLRVEIGVEYPQPIVTTTRAVRAHVGATVERLCSVEVRDVDVVVTRLRRRRSGQRVR